MTAAARDEVKHQTGASAIQEETITRFTRKQVIQLVLLVALVWNSRKRKHAPSLICG